MTKPIYDISLGEVNISQECRDDVMEILKRGQLTEADWTHQAEQTWASIIGTKEAIACTNGTVGLSLCYMAAPGSTVAAPALTFPATVNPAYFLGKRVKLVDTEGLFMSHLHPEAQIQVPVHLMGIPHPKITSMADECRRRDWTLIEDACEGAGAEINGRRVGSIGDFGVFSFYVSHNISAGEYGMITTNDSHAAAQIRSLKNHGRKLDAPPGYFSHRMAGMNYKVTEIASCIAWHQMRLVDEIRATRLSNARVFQKEITHSNVTTPRIPDGASLLGMPLEVREDEAHGRDGLIQWLFDSGIECRAMFPVIGRHDENFPMAERISSRSLYVPVHQGLGDEGVSRIVARINAW